jgi:uncharacterized protein (DUF362 family)
VESLNCTRRDFIRKTALLAAGAGLVTSCGDDDVAPSETVEPVTLRPAGTQSNTVAVVRAESYGPGLRDDLARALGLLGGIGGLVGGRTVAVKVNLTGYAETLFGRPPGETYATHGELAAAVATSLFAAGARRVRFVESAQYGGSLEEFVAGFGWDVAALHRLGDVEFENTRNLGLGRRYSRIAVPNGRLFSYFDVNHSYEDADVLVSLAKLKNHVTAGVTLSMKNLFGITPNALYGTEAPNESAVAYRGCLHTRSEGNVAVLPGEIAGFADQNAYFRVPNIVVDEAAARPIDLAVIDAVTSISGGEGPWNPNLRFETPRVLIAGLNPVATDAVALRVMGYEDPLAVATPPFGFCVNHILLAHQAGLGRGDLAGIDLRGLTIREAEYPYPSGFACSPDARERTIAASGRG